MARFAVGCSIDASGAPASSGMSDPLNASTTATDSATVTSTAATAAAALAVLVADGASPTQGHVNTLNTAYGALATAITALQADLAPGSLGTNTTVVLSFDATVVVTRSKLRRALNALFLRVQGSNALTP